MKPASVDAQRVSALIARLDSNMHAPRRQAFDELSVLGRAVEGKLKGALGEDPSVEVRIRLEMLLEACTHPYPCLPETRRLTRRSFEE